MVDSIGKLSNMTLGEIYAEIDDVRRKKGIARIETEPYKAHRALQIIREIQEESERNGLSNMTLEEVNAEIYAARREMEAEAK